MIKQNIKRTFGESPCYLRVFHFWAPHTPVGQRNFATWFWLAGSFCWQCFASSMVSSNWCICGQHPRVCPWGSSVKTLPRASMNSKPSRHFPSAQRLETSDGKWKLIVQRLAYSCSSAPKVKEPSSALRALGKEEKRTPPPTVCWNAGWFFWIPGDASECVQYLGPHVH